MMAQCELVSDCDLAPVWRVQAEILPGQVGRSWGAAEDGVPDEGAEVVGVRAWCPELGLSTDDMCLLAYLWREGADDQDVAEELLRQWGGSADDWH